MCVWHCCLGLGEGREEREEHLQERLHQEHKHERLQQEAHHLKRLRQPLHGHVRAHLVGSCLHVLRISLAGSLPRPASRLRRVYDASRVPRLRRVYDADAGRVPRPAAAGSWDASRGTRDASRVLLPQAACCRRQLACGSRPACCRRPQAGLLPAAAGSRRGTRKRDARYQERSEGPRPPSKRGVCHTRLDVRGVARQSLLPARGLGRGEAPESRRCSW